MTYGHLRADCLYTGISSGPNARYRVWESLYLYLLPAISTNVTRYQTHHRWRFFFFQEDSAMMHMHCACNTVQTIAALSTSFRRNSPELNALIKRFRESYSSVSKTESKRFKKSRIDYRSWILAMHWYSIWVKKCDFCVSPFCQLVQNFQKQTLFKVRK